MQNAVRYFARVPWPLLAVLTAIVVLTASVGLTPPAPTRDRPGVYHDRDLYQAVTARVQAGENYYTAAAAEQRAHGYPTKPAVTFREPTEAWLLAALRFDFARGAVLFALAVFTALAIHRALEHAGVATLGRVAGLTLAATGIAICGVRAAPYLHEIWAGLLISSSLAVWRPGRYGWSVCLAFAACLFREIATPVLLVMAGCAVVERRWREAAAWCAATAVFGGVALAHLWFASRQALPTDITSAAWAAIGGWRFIVATARQNILLAWMPAAAVSVIVALALLGMAHAEGFWGRRLAAVTFSFAAVFWFVGRPDNYYWGGLYAPLLPLGLLYAPRALRALVPHGTLPFPRLGRQNAPASVPRR